MHAEIRAKRRAAVASLGYNLTATAVKLVAAFITGSVSLLSEALHSATDVVASLFAYLGVRVGATPPDPQHPYGHGKVETLAGFGEAVLLIAIVGYLLFEGSFGRYSLIFEYCACCAIQSPPVGSIPYLAVGRVRVRAQFEPLRKRTEVHCSAQGTGRFNQTIVYDLQQLGRYERTTLAGAYTGVGTERRACRRDGGAHSQLEYLSRRGRE